MAKGWVARSRRSDSRAREKNPRRKKNEGRLEVYNLTRSPLTTALYYLNAWNRLKAELSMIASTSKNGNGEAMKIA